MPFLVRPAERQVEMLAGGVRREGRVAPDRLPDGRLSVAVVEIPEGASLDLDAPVDGLTWFQPLSGSLDVDDVETGTEYVVMMSHGRGARLIAREGCTVLVVEVPHAHDATGEPDVRRVDWSTEPVLLSEHDSRRRIYLASTGLWGTEAVKGEMIIYPPGAVGAPHHHEGAEHFQFVVSGAGTAILGDERVPLTDGDLLYNLENEVHSFENLTDADMTFVEFFVPGKSVTVWAPGASACAWNPLETDVMGRPAARRLEAHIHGQGNV